MSRNFQLFTGYGGAIEYIKSFVKTASQKEISDKEATEILDNIIDNPKASNVFGIKVIEHEKSN